MPLTCLASPGTWTSLCRAVPHGVAVDVLLHVGIVTVAVFWLRRILAFSCFLHFADVDLHSVQLILRPRVVEQARWLELIRGLDVAEAGRVLLMQTMQQGLWTLRYDLFWNCAFVLKNPVE